LLECAAPMETPTHSPARNGILWTGVLFTILALASFVLFFEPIPGQQALPWLNLLLSVLAVVFAIMGLRRASSQPGLYRGKIAGWAFTIFSVLLLAFTTFAFYAARHVPAPNGAPGVGQKAPDFELKKTDGQTVSLAQLLAEAPSGAGGAAAPKAVLLVFYRGYW
jgi:AhpC/TSA family